jgi:hypothetical protein
MRLGFGRKIYRARLLGLATPKDSEDFTTHGMGYWKMQTAS